MDVDDNINPQERKELEAQDSIEQLKAKEKITELTLENFNLLESNIRLQKEKEELSAVVEFIKNKLTEFSSTEPVPTADEGSSEGAGEDGLMFKLTNLINQNRDLKRKVNDAQQLVQNLKNDKLKDTTEITRLNDELMTTKKKIDEVNKKYEELNNFKKKNEELNRSLMGQLLTSATEKNISLRETQEILENKMNSLKLVLVTTKKTVEKLDEDKTLTFDILQKEEETLQNLKGISCEDILAEINKGLTEHSTSCYLQKQKLRNADKELYSLRESNYMLKNEISRMEEEHEENEDDHEDENEDNYEDDYDPTIENLKRSNSDLINQLNYLGNLCAQKDAEIKDLSTRFKNFKRQKYFRRFQRH